MHRHTTYNEIKEADVRLGECIAISGVGRLGHLAVQYAKVLLVSWRIASTSAVPSSARTRIWPRPSAPLKARSMRDIEMHAVRVCDHHVFDRLEHGDVPLAVLDFGAPEKNKTMKSLMLGSAARSGSAAISR